MAIELDQPLLPDEAISIVMEYDAKLPKTIARANGNLVFVNDDLNVGIFQFFSCNAGYILNLDDMQGNAMSNITVKCVKEAQPVWRLTNGGIIPECIPGTSLYFCLKSITVYIII